MGKLEKLMQSLTGAGVADEVRMLACLAALIPPTRRVTAAGSGSALPRGLLVHALPASGQTRGTLEMRHTGRGQAVWKPGPKPTNANGHRTMTPGRFCSHSRREIAYSTSPCSSPGIDTGQSAVKERTSRIPDFCITRREAVLTAMVEATTRCTSNSANPLAINAREPSVAYPFPHAAQRSR